MREERIVIAGNNTTVSPALVRQLRGSFSTSIDPRFIIILLLSLGLHGGFMILAKRTKLPPPEELTLEKIPERFVKLIIDKPLPPTPKKQAQEKAQNANTKAPVEEPTLIAEEKKAVTEEQKQVLKEKAVEAVSQRSSRVEQKLRTVGVLGILTGQGATAKGPAVLDVLGSTNNRKERFQDLEMALSDMKGLKKTTDVEVLNQKLVSTKEVKLSNKENIDDIIAGMGSAKTMQLEKVGNFIIQRPESVEGAGSTSAKRDDRAINTVVSTHKASIKLSYEKFLKRDPTLSGKVTVRFTISALGQVTSVTIIENTTGSDELGQEIIRKVRLWQFEAVSEGDVTVTYPFVFQPS
jgi:TonB family protein